MRRRWFGLGVLAVLWVCGCARGGGLGGDDTLSAGQRVEELVARKGQPQEIQPGPGGGQTYVYTTSNLDQMATMGGGAWAKPDQVHYRLNEQGVITEVLRYPYGKRKFIFPSREKPVQVAQAPAAGETGGAAAATPSALGTPAQPAPAPAPAPATPPPVVARAPAKAPASPARSGLEGASRLELNMSREEVQRVLGDPERTEGFRAGGRAVVVWHYWLEGSQGRRAPTPLVFEEGRLSGWGENYYRRRLRELAGQQP
jgi:hypothetical protein